MYEENKNTGYKINYGFMSDEPSSATVPEDRDRNEEDVDNFTDVEMPGGNPNHGQIPGEEEQEKKPEENNDHSYRFQSGGNRQDENIRIEVKEERISESPNPPNNIIKPVSYHDDKVDAMPKVETEESKNEKLSSHQAEIIKNILDKITAEIEQIRKVLPGEVEEIGNELSTTPVIEKQEVNSNIVEGVFDGEGMVGSNGKHYDVPANYASKSKLVEGDILKLTINPDGSFLFKQIGPSERNRIVGTLAYDPAQGRYLVTAESGKKWLILTASVTYFKGRPGDEAVILIPKNVPSRWAAVENIMPKKQENNSFGGSFRFN